MKEQTFLDQCHDIYKKYNDLYYYEIIHLQNDHTKGEYIVIPCSDKTNIAKVALDVIDRR